MFFFKSTLNFKQLVFRTTPQLLITANINPSDSNDRTQNTIYYPKRWATSKFQLLTYKNSIRDFFLAFELQTPGELAVKLKIYRTNPYNMHEFFLNKLLRHGKKKKFGSLLFNSYYNFFWTLPASDKTHEYPAYFHNLIPPFFKDNLILFIYQLERLPKQIKKFSRIRGAAFITIWKYLPYFKRKKWVMNEISKYLTSQTGLTLYQRLTNFWTLFFNGSILKNLQKKLFFINNYIINNFAFAVGLNSKTTRVR